MNNYIEKISIFKDIDEKSKSQLKKIGKIKSLNKKEILFYEKYDINKIYFLLEGKVSIFKINENGDRKIIFILGKGEMINQLLLGEVKTSAVGCNAFENSLVLEYDMDEFSNIMKNDFNLTKNILIYMEKRIRRLYRQLKNSTSTTKIEKKLASKLYRIGKEFGVNIEEWTYINTHLSITYIADMLGCKRETLSRAMKILQDKGLIKIENKKIYIKQKELAMYFKGN